MEDVSGELLAGVVVTAVLLATIMDVALLTDCIDRGVSVTVAMALG